MKRFLKRLIGIGLASVFFVVSSPVSVLAADSVELLQVSGLGETETIPEDAVTYEGIYNFEESPFQRGNNITAASLKVTPRSDEILIEILTSCNFVATKVGGKKVYVQEKVWYGWKTVAYLEDSHAVDCGSHLFETHCTVAEKGKTYRVLCTHYAVESNGTEHIVDNQLQEFVYN